MTDCVMCDKKTDNEYSLIKAKFKESVSHIKEERVPILGRNYRSDESPEVRKVGETRYYMEKIATLTSGLCPDCMKEKRKEDFWFRWIHLLPFGVAGLGMLLGGDVAIIQLFSLFLLFMSLIGLVMRIARYFSHNDDIRIAEAMEGYFLDSERGGDGLTITSREFLYRPKKSTERFVLFSEKEWAKLESDDNGVYLS
jgi:hypothetical protein